MKENDKTTKEVIQSLGGLLGVYAKGYLQAYQNMDFQACKLLNDAYKNQINSLKDSEFVDVSQLPKTLEVLMN